MSSTVAATVSHDHLVLHAKSDAGAVADFAKKVAVAGKPMVTVAGKPPQERPKIASSKKIVAAAQAHLKEGGVGADVAESKNVVRTLTGYVKSSVKFANGIMHETAVSSEKQNLSTEEALERLRTAQLAAGRMMKTTSQFALKIAAAREETKILRGGR